MRDQTSLGLSDFGRLITELHDLTIDSELNLSLAACDELCGIIDSSWRTVELKRRVQRRSVPKVL